jgi:hypothetical protein
VTTVTVVSDLTGLIYFHWYIDGAYVAVTTTPQWSVTLPEGSQARIACQDTNDDDYDPIANAPAGYPATRSLVWVRSVDDDVREYLIEESEDGGEWTEIGTVPHTGAWTYSFETGRLTDLLDYQWRVKPIDAAGNVGASLTVAVEHIVRSPDAPDFTATFDSGTKRVAFAEAA